MTQDNHTPGQGMTLRERFADWITGGALSEARKDRDIWQGYFEDAHRADKAKSAELLAAYDGWLKAGCRLDRIARIARGEE